MCDATCDAMKYICPANEKNLLLTLHLKFLAMIQRIQTIWFLLASACGFVSLKTSFYSGHKTDAPQVFSYLNGTSTIPIVILTVGVAIASLVLVFMFKDRKMQMKTAIVVLLLGVLNIVLYFLQQKNFIPAESSFDLTAVFVFAVPVFLFLACRGIYNDEKLIKNADRLR